jgi:CheY-like chemotaxis protein
MKNAAGQIAILLIEDDELSRELLALQMTGCGYLVATVESGDAALSYLKQTQPQLPDVILTDLHMPGLSGLDLACRLRMATDTDEPTILLGMSASRPEPALSEAFAGFLMKPFTMQQLTAQIAAGWGASAPASIPAPGALPPAPANSLDENVVQQLARSMSATQLQQLYEMCLSDAEARVGRMRLATSTGDESVYRSEAHAIKGSAGMVGALELQHLASEAEVQEFAGANQIASLDELLMACGRLRRILVGHEKMVN